MYALLEKEAIRMKQGKKPMLPVWLSPTQIRFIPVKDEFVSDCEGFVDALQKIYSYYHIRGDIDDREESVGRKIRDAEKEWVSVIVVVGDRERNEKAFSPRFRSGDLGEGDKTYSVNELHDLIMEHVKDFPSQALPLPLYLSKRAKFK